MKSLKVWLAIALVAVGLSKGILAQENCYTSTTGDDVNGSLLAVTDQSQLDELMDRCGSIITGDIRIESSYSGSFDLTGLVSLFGSIYTDPVNPPEGLSTVTCPQLRNIDNINISPVTTVSLDALDRVGNLTVVQPSNEGVLALSSLKTAASLRLEGIPNELKLESLTSVDGELVICSARGCDPNSIDEAQISMPNLESASFLHINGSITRIQIPNLTKLGESPDGTPLPSSLLLELASAVVVEFSLQTLHGSVIFNGAIDSLMLPSLAATDADISVYATRPVDIYSTLIRATSLTLHGQINSVDLPNVQHIDHVEIGSSITTGCSSSLQKFFVQFSGDDQPWCTPPIVPTLAPNPSPSFTPTPTTTPTHTPTPSSYHPGSYLSSGTKLGIGLGAASGAVVVIIAIFALYKRCTTVTAKPGQLDGTDRVELVPAARRPRAQRQPRTREPEDVDDDVPPPYSREPLPPPA